MSNTDAFALPHSDLNPFLFADIGVEAGGNKLTVLSVFARLDIDPWQESSRLAQLPRGAAISALASLIAALPGSAAFVPDATATAARLVVLLPGQRAREPARLSTPENSDRRQANRRAAFYVAALLALFFSLAANLVLRGVEPETARATTAATTASANPSAIYRSAGLKKP